METEYCFQTPPPNKKKPKTFSKSSPFPPSSESAGRANRLSSSSSDQTNSVKKAWIKKTHSQLKGLVSNFGELITIWKNDNEQMVILFETLLNLYQTIASINRTFFSTSVWRYRIFDELKQVAYHTDHDFSDLRERLVGKLIMEMEPLYAQLKTFQ